MLAVIGSYFVSLPDAQAVIFTGGVGEINAPDAKLRAFVIPTNEELLIARDTFRVLTGSGQVQPLATATDG